MTEKQVEDVPRTASDIMRPEHKRIRHELAAQIVALLAEPENPDVGWGIYYDLLIAAFPSEAHKALIAEQLRATARQAGTDDRSEWAQAPIAGRPPETAPRVSVAESRALAEAIELRRAEGNMSAAADLQSLFDKLARIPVSRPPETAGAPTEVTKRLQNANVTDGLQGASVAGTSPDSPTDAVTDEECAAALGVLTGEGDLSYWRNSPKMDDARRVLEGFLFRRMSAGYVHDVTKRDTTHGDEEVYWQLDQAVEDAITLPRPDVQIRRLQSIRDMFAPGDAK